MSCADDQTACLAAIVIVLVAAATGWGASSRRPAGLDDEINVLMEQGAEARVFHESEQVIVSNVCCVADEQRIGAIMTHRDDIYVLDLDEPEDVIHLSCGESIYADRRLS